MTTSLDALHDDHIAARVERHFGFVRRSDLPSSERAAIVDDADQVDVRRRPEELDERGAGRGNRQSGAVEKGHQEVDTNRTND